MRNSLQRLGAFGVTAFARFPRRREGRTLQKTTAKYARLNRYPAGKLRRTLNDAFHSCRQTVLNVGFIGKNLVEVVHRRCGKEQVRAGLSVLGIKLKHNIFDVTTDREAEGSLEATVVRWEQLARGALPLAKAWYLAKASRARREFFLMRLYRFRKSLSTEEMWRRLETMPRMHLLLRAALRNRPPTQT